MLITFSKAYTGGQNSAALADTVCNEVDRISYAVYDGNLRADITWHRGRRVRFVIRARSSKAFGARRSWTGRRSVAASWEAHRDCMRALFRLDPQARLLTGMATYKGATGFEQTHPSTQFRNIGSQMQPAYMRELSLDRNGD